MNFEILGRVRRAADLARRVKGHLGARQLAGIMAGAVRRGVGPLDIIRAHASAVPDKTALVCDDQRLSYSELAERTRHLTHALRGRGVGKPLRAVVFVGNCIEWVEISSALSSLGIGSVYASSRLKVDELRYICEDANPAAIFFGPRQRPVIERLVADADLPAQLVPGGLIALDNQESSPRETAYRQLLAEGAARDTGKPVPVRAEAETMIYTSGTTGHPKGAVRKGPGVIASLLAMAGELGFTHDDVHLTVCPLYHSAPAANTMLNIILGCTVVISPKFDPESTLALVDRERVSTSFLVPYMYRQIVQLPEDVRARYDLRSLRVCGSSAERLPQHLKEQILDVLGPVLFEFYGSTETGMNTLLRPEDVRRKPDSVGRAVPGNEIILLGEDGREVPTGEVGQIWIRNGGLMEGYHGKPEATAEATKRGYMSVGDLGRFDEDGFLFISGRKQDMVISAGVNIYPAEIEKVLRNHEGVAEVAVVGVPDETWGEALYAWVVPTGGAQPTAEELIAWAGEQMAGYKKPKYVGFTDELPRNPTGKVLKRELRVRARAELGIADA